MAFLADPTCLTAALLQLEELGRFRTQQKGKGREGDVNDLDISVDCLEHELVGLIQVFYDREDCRLVFAQPSTAEQASLKQFYAQQPAETIAGPAKQSSPPQLPRTPTPPPIVIVSSSAVAKTLYANASTQTAPRTAVRDASTQFQLDSNITTNGSAMLEDEAPGKTPSGEDKASNATASAVDDLSAERNLAMIKVLKCLVSLKLQDQVKSVIEIDQVMTTAECVACGDRYVEKLVFSAPCAHKYCPECLVSLFQASTTDESLFPPRCCREVIPLEGAVCEQLPTKLILELERKQVEFSTTDRTYCCGGSCGKFIPPREIVSRRGYCCACQLLTCTICKGAIHEGLCPDDPAKKELLAAARNNGWQQCYGCQNLVELAIGCNHITCRCGSQFCYVCGERWKTCACAQWDVVRLTHRAEQLVGRGLFGGRDNENALGQAEVHIIQNHQCLHVGWDIIFGIFVCEECHDEMPTFIWECRRCRLSVCRRCRYNRLGGLRARA